jgi:hypothetical protein
MQTMMRVVRVPAAAGAGTRQLLAGQREMRTHQMRQPKMRRCGFVVFSTLFDHIFDYYHSFCVLHGYNTKLLPLPSTIVVGFMDIRVFVCSMPPAAARLSYVHVTVMIRGSAYAVCCGVHLACRLMRSCVRASCASGVDALRGLGTMNLTR